MSETKTKWHWLCKGEAPPNNNREVLLAIIYNDFPIQAYYKSGRWFGSRELTDYMEDIDVNNREIADKSIENYFQAWCELPEMPPTFND